MTKKRIPRWDRVQKNTYYVTWVKRTRNKRKMVNLGHKNKEHKMVIHDAKSVLTC